MQYARRLFYQSAWGYNYANSNEEIDVSDKPQKHQKSSDHIADRGEEKQSLNPDVARTSQTDAKGHAQIESIRTNRHDGSAGKSDQGDLESVRIEAIDEQGNKRVISRRDGGSEKDLIPGNAPIGGYAEEHKTDGGITLKGIIPGTDSELENITTETMRALSPENLVVENALQIREQIEKLMKPGPDRDKAINQLKADVAASLLLDDMGENAIAGTHNAVSDSTPAGQAGKSAESQTSWLPLAGKIASLPLDKQFQIIGSGLQAFNNELEHQKLEAAVGTVEGIGDGFKSIGEGIAGLANGLGKIGQFSVDVVTNNPRAIETGASAGEVIGKTLVNGIKLFEMSHDYLYNIGFTGDYAKPFNDIANFGNELDRRWQELPTRERAKFAAKLSTETLAGMAIPAGATKIAKSEKITELMESFAVEAKRLGKGPDAAATIEDAVDTLARRGGRAIELNEDKLFTDKRQIHDRRHLKNTEDLQDLVKGIEIDVLSDGASDAFVSKLAKFVDALDPHEKHFLDKNKIKISACRTVPEKVPGSSPNTAGMWVPGDNTIYIPEKVYLQEIDNPAVEFHLRHEIGHAFNDASHVNEYEYSMESAFRKSYKTSFDKVPEEHKSKFNFSRDRDHWNSLTDEERKTHNDPVYSAHEVFADLYAHVTGFGVRTEYSESLEKCYGNECSEFVRKKVEEYIATMRQGR